jgi:PIN domain nuclease of toxin-antitoxin system
MARYLLDSNAYLRSESAPEALRQEARQTIADTSNDLFISVASIWELSIKAAKGKLPYFAQMIARGPGGITASLAALKLELLPVQMLHALRSVSLPQHHKDPFDRVMIAQALAENLVLITTDRAFVRYTGLRVLAA